MRFRLDKSLNRLHDSPTCNLHLAYQIHQVFQAMQCCTSSSPFLFRTFCCYCPFELGDHCTFYDEGDSWESSRDFSFLPKAVDKLPRHGTWIRMEEQAIADRKPQDPQGAEFINMAGSKRFFGGSARLQRWEQLHHFSLWIRGDPAPPSRRHVGSNRKAGSAQLLLTGTAIPTHESRAPIYKAAI